VGGASGHLLRPPHPTAQSIRVPQRPSGVRRCWRGEGIAGTHLHGTRSRNERVTEDYFEIAQIVLAGTGSAAFSRCRARTSGDIPCVALPWRQGICGQVLRRRGLAPKNQILG
jgi:hypothetical protein